MSEETLKTIDGVYGQLLGDVLGIIPEDVPASAGPGKETQLIDLLLRLRRQARENKDWATSDAIRDELAGIGVILEDRPEGTIWRLTG